MNFRLPRAPEGILLGGDITKPHLAGIVNYLKPLGYEFFAASSVIKEHLESTVKEGCKVQVIEFPVKDKRALREVFKKYDIRGVFNLAAARADSQLDQDYISRRNAVDFQIPIFMEPEVRDATREATCMCADTQER